MLDHLIEAASRKKDEKKYRTNGAAQKLRTCGTSKKIKTSNSLCFCCRAQGSFVDGNLCDAVLVRKKVGAYHDDGRRSASLPRVIQDARLSSRVRKLRPSSRLPAANQDPMLRPASICACRKTTRRESKKREEAPHRRRAGALRVGKDRSGVTRHRGKRRGNNTMVTTRSVQIQLEISHPKSLACCTSIRLLQICKVTHRRFALYCKTER